MVRHVMVLVVGGMFVGQIALSAEPTQDGAQQPEETTLAGCVQAGANPGEFVLLSDDKTTYQIHADDEVEIAPHVSHRVELTGTVEKTESGMIFRAKALKMLSPSCEA